jgi:hypothetical protein
VAESPAVKEVSAEEAAVAETVEESPQPDAATEEPVAELPITYSPAVTPIEAALANSMPMPDEMSAEMHSEDNEPIVEEAAESEPAEKLATAES